MTAPLLELRGVGKRYRRGGRSTLREVFTGSSHRGRLVEALHDVDLVVGAGDAVGLVGRNGGGKSTLLRVAAGLTAPSSGTVARRAAVSGMLTLNGAASAELSGADNAVTAAVLAGLPPAEARRRLPDIAAFAELDDAVMREPLRTYSSGMSLRLAFAAAAVTEPDLLLVDEVLAVGDQSFQEKCLAHIEGLRARGCAILVASHVMTQLRRLTDTAIWLRSGTVHARGAVHDVLDAYEHSLDRSAGPVVELPSGGFRRGTEEVLLTSVRCTDERGADIRSTAPGAPLSVRMAYQRTGTPGSAHFGVSLRRAGAPEPLVDISTDGGAGPVGLEAEGTVRVAFDRLDLAPGEYWVDAGVWSTDWDVTYDYHWDALGVVVEGRAGAKGLVPPHRWSVGPSGGRS